MKPFIGLQFAPSIAATAPAVPTAQTHTLPQIRASFASARTAYKSLLRSDPSSAPSASATTAAANYQYSAALGSLGREQAWKKEIQGDMRACINAELVLRRIESAGIGGGDGAEEAPLKWRVEGLEEREAKGVGRWIIPVVGDV